MTSDPETRKTAEAPASTVTDATREVPPAERAGWHLLQRRRAESLRRATMQAFDTRSEAWQQAGLSAEIDRAEARKALREAIALLVLVAGVLVAFAYRDSLFPGGAKAVRYITAGVLVVLGWGLARTAAKGLGPALFKRMDPATAGTVGFLIRLGTILTVVVGSLSIAGVRPATLAVGGAFTAVVLGLAAQQTLGNLIAGAMLLSTRPIRVGERVRVQGGVIAGTIEGTVASFGLFYTTFVNGGDRILVPNSAMMGIAVIPLRDPESVELTARFDAAAVTPQSLQRALDERITVPLRRPPQIDLEEIDSDDVLTFRITVTPESALRGADLASEVLDAIRAGGGEGKTDGEGDPASGEPKAFADG